MHACVYMCVWVPTHVCVQVGMGAQRVCIQVGMGAQHVSVYRWVWVPMHVRVQVEPQSWCQEPPLITLPPFVEGCYGNLTSLMWQDSSLWGPHLYLLGISVGSGCRISSPHAGTASAFTTKLSLQP